MILLRKYCLWMCRFLYSKSTVSLAVGWESFACSAARRRNFFFFFFSTSFSFFVIIIIIIFSSSSLYSSLPNGTRVCGCWRFAILFDYPWSSPFLSFTQVSPCRLAFRKRPAQVHKRWNVEKKKTVEYLVNVAFSLKKKWDSVDLVWKIERRHHPSKPVPKIKNKIWWIINTICLRWIRLFSSSF